MVKINPSERGVRAPTHVQYGKKLTDVPTDVGIGTVEELYEELQGYWDILLGRELPPVESPYLSLQEVSTAYYSRGMEIHAHILEGERARKVIRGSDLNKFRTGYLRDFCEVAKRAADLGSRRMTQEQLLHDQRYDLGETY